MKKIIRILLIGFFCALPTLVQAQATRVVNGVISLPNDAIIRNESFTCYVYSFYTKEDAERNLKDFKEYKIRANGVPRADYQDFKSVFVEDQVSFDIEAVNEGYIMILLAGKDDYEVKPEMRQVRKNMTQPTFSIARKKEKALPSDMRTDTIKEVIVTGGPGEERLFPKGRSVEENGMLFLRIDDLPYAFRSRTNSRIIIQPYWLDGPDMGKNKVFAYADPVVYDYDEYDCTQTRRMNFDKYLNDSLAHYIVNETTSTSTRTRFVVKSDTIRMQNYQDTLSGYNPDESYPYPARAIIAVEDYNERYLLDTIRIDEGERTNYIKFLDFSFEKNLDVNLAGFEERMEIRPMDSKGEVKLNFEVGKATLNPKDTTNTRILAGARRELQDAFRQNSSKLKFMQVFGYSSPEGNPQSNEDLARRRADFVKNELMSVIPRNMHRLIQPSESEILGWDVVADSLAKDSLHTIAQQVRDIVAQYPGNLVKQGQAVANLSSYATIIKPIYLPKLRTVRYNYIKVEDRTLSNDELVKMFDEGKDSDPNEGFTRAHYYSLIKYYWDDRKEPDVRARLEEIAKRALVNTRLTKEDIEEGDSLYNEGYWALAANILATSYIERDTFDLDLLRPFINRAKLVDPVSGEEYYAEGLEKMRQKFDLATGQTLGIIKYTNYPEIIAEQMIMLLMQPGRKYMEELGQLTDMIENDKKCMNDPTYGKLLALANCKRGYYQGTDERAIRTRAEVSDISLTNSVIMNIVKVDAMGDESAREILLEKQFFKLPETSIAWYLKAIIELLRPSPNYDNAAKYLAESFKLDLRKMPTANNDQQLIHNRKKIVGSAFAKWEEMMKAEVYSNLDSLKLTSEGIDSLTLANWQKEGEYEKMGPYVITNHPYYWYEKAVAARLGNADDVRRYLEKCVACDPDYLSVINVARYADEEVKASKKMQKLLEMFYFNDMRKRR